MAGFPTSRPAWNDWPRIAKAIFRPLERADGSTLREEWEAREGNRALVDGIISDIEGIPLVEAQLITSPNRPSSILPTLDADGNIVQP